MCSLRGSRHGRCPGAACRGPPPEYDSREHPDCAQDAEGDEGGAEAVDEFAGCAVAAFGGEDRGGDRDAEHGADLAEGVADVRRDRGLVWAAERMTAVVPVGNAMAIPPPR